MRLALNVVTASTNEVKTNDLNANNLHTQASVDRLQLLQISEKKIILKIWVEWQKKLD